MRFKKFILFPLALLLGFSPLSSVPVPEEDYPVVILGGGIAGLTAAVQVSQAGFQPLIITGPSPGGIIVQSHSISNWPGETKISGSELADKLQKQVKSTGALFLQGQVIDIDVSRQPFVLTIQSPDKSKIQRITARTCIIALGALPRFLDVPGEQANLYTNIFTCAPCDGLRYKDKTVAVIGGGDSALTEAHYLSNLAQKVYIVLRKDQFKTIQPKFRDSVLSRPNVEVIYNTSVEAFQKTSNGMVLQLTSPKGSAALSVNGAFLAIGSIPNTDLFKGKLELDKDGYIVLKNQQETSVPQIFAAGDVSDKTFKQAMTAAGDATKAALQAQKYFEMKNSLIGAKQAIPTEALAIKELSSLDHLQSVVSSSDKPVIVYFYSTRCTPCRAFSSTYDAWSNQFKDKAIFTKVSSENAPECFETFHVDVIPTVLVFDSKEKLLFQGRGSREIAQFPAAFLEKK
jgi:thioredoxin reductase (NADPH)